MFTHSARCRRRRRRRRTLLLSAVLATTILVLLHGRAQPRAGSAADPVRPTAPAGRVREPGASRTRAGASGTLAAAGQGLSWTDFHGIQLPASAQDGPHHARGGLAWGFTDTPRGALLAAINIAVRTAALWGPAIYQPTITRQVTGPDTAALLRADASDYAQLRAAAHAGAGKPAGRGYAAETAFRFDAYSPAGATVDIVTAGPGSGGTTVLAATRIEVIWRGGDWRVVAPPGGDWDNSAAAVSSLTGYTTFPGEE
jgi:hypothetical protein